MKARWDAKNASPTKGVDAAISARTAKERGRVLRQVLTEEEEKLRWGLASAAKESELVAWKTFEVLKLEKEGALSKSVVDTR